MLNLPNVQTTQREEHDEHYVIHAESVMPVRDCPECRSANSVVIGSRIQPYADTPMHGKTVQLKFKRIRFRCKACTKTYFEPLEWLSDDYRMPRRTVEYVVRRAAKVPFLSISSELGIAEKTARNVFATRQITA